MKRVKVGPAGRAFRWTMGLALLAAVGWAVLPSIMADDAAVTDSEQTTARATGALAEAIQVEKERQQREHQERVVELTQLKQSLIKAGSSSDRIDAVDRAILKENEDFDARMRMLVYWQDADVDDDDNNDLNREMNDFARAIGRQNQSYVIRPVVGHGSATGGSYYIDAEEHDDVNDADNGPPDNRDENLEDEDVDTVRLPPPLFVPHPYAYYGDLGRHRWWRPRIDGQEGWEFVAPAWLYGEVSWDRERRHPDVIIPLDPAPAPNDPQAIQNEIRRLELEIEALKARLNPPE